MVLDGKRRCERALGVALAILSTVAYGHGLAATVSPANEGVIATQAATLAEHGWRDQEGRAAPLFVHVEADLWLPPFPVYSTVLLSKLAPAARPHARWAAALCGAADVWLLYVFLVRCVRSPLVACAAALVLLSIPAHVVFSRAAMVDGIWQVPFILGWAIGMTALTERPSPRGRWLFTVGAASLAASTYTQPSAALMSPLFALATLTIVRASEGWRIRDVLPAAGASVAILLPLLVWYARYPGTYPDTFGRWVLHPAHLRNPLAWWQAVSNWHRVANVTALFWDFFAPSHLFIAPEGPGFCGMFPTLVALPLAVGVYALVRARSETNAVECMGPVVMSACIIGPLAAAMFEHARSDERALILIPFGIFVATWGAVVTWRGGGIAGRIILVASLVGVAVQDLVALR